MIHARTVVFILLILVLSPSVAAQTDSTCPTIVTDALTYVDTLCSETGRNQACYGNLSLVAEPRAGVDALKFDAPGDIAEVADIQSLNLSPMQAPDEWGVVMMKLQANLPETLPGQNVTMLLFGDVQIKAANDTPMQAFYFKSGIGDSACNEAPESGILIQTPEGVGEVELSINAVNIRLGSTAYLQAQPDDHLYINVLEGQATVEAFDLAVAVPAGMQAKVPVDINLVASGSPSDPEPVKVDLFVPIPLQLLPEQNPLVEIRATVAAHTTGTWTVFAPAGAVWTDAGVYIEQGQTFTLAVTGEAVSCRYSSGCSEGYDQWVSPTGMPGNICGDCTVTDVPEISAVARIGDAKGFYVGTGGTFTAQSSGMLQLGVNDAYHEDNGGGFDFTITVP